MGDVVVLPSGRGGGSGGGGGADGSMLEMRVAQLETEIRAVQDATGRLEAAATALAQDFKEFRQDLKDLRSKDVFEIRNKLSFVEGRLQGMPGTWQLLTIVLATWTLGTGLLFAVLKFAQP